MEESKQIPGFFDENPSDMIRDHKIYYLLVNAIARRSRQLQSGERALAVPADGKKDTIYVAIEEFLQDKLEIIPKSSIVEEVSEEEADFTEDFLDNDDDDISFEATEDEDDTF